MIVWTQRDPGEDTTAWIKKWYYRWDRFSATDPPACRSPPDSFMAQYRIIAMTPGFLSFRCCILAGATSKNGSSIISLFSRSVISSNILWYALQ